MLTLTEIGAALIAAITILVGWFSWKPLFQIAENAFWSLNALAVQPIYAFGREGLRHATEAGRTLSGDRRGRLRAVNSAGSGIIVSASALLAALMIWPSSRWIGGFEYFSFPHLLIIPSIANAAVLMLSYLSCASLLWGFADARMAQPVNITVFDDGAAHGRVHRVAHLSDLHAVGERYGFRIESGRAGPQGNERLEDVMAKLSAIHALDPLDHVLVSGDLTDAGRATEWAEFAEILTRYPDIASRLLLLPGNHDLNIVDRSNPARLDLLFSPGKRLRQIRALSAISAVHGSRVFVVQDGGTTARLSDILASHRDPINEFTEQGGFRRAFRLRSLFDDLYPMVVPPHVAGGIGIFLLNSNAETHFSFTNALGLIALGQARRMTAAMDRCPDARWIIALHHHLMEYPMPVKTFAERIGTALINGSWFVRTLQPYAHRIVVMHGHRHIDWIGTFGRLRVVSAPSPVMMPIDATGTHFYIHGPTTGSDGELRLLQPERVDVDV
jgi:metallophosphoesterase superfamily enzyme